MNKEVNVQKLIVYDVYSKTAIDATVYTAVYDDDQAREQIVYCVKRHGRGSNVRCVSGRTMI